MVMIFKWTHYIFNATWKYFANSILDSFGYLYLIPDYIIRLFYVTRFIFNIYLETAVKGYFLVGENME